MIFVKANAKLDPKRLAVMDTEQEQEKLFEGGLVIVKANVGEEDKVYEVVETGTILQAIKDQRLVIVDGFVKPVETKETANKEKVTK
jgi:ribosomal protein L9